MSTKRVPKRTKVRANQKRLHPNAQGNTLLPTVQGMVDEGLNKVFNLATRYCAEYDKDATVSDLVDAYLLAVEGRVREQRAAWARANGGDK